MTLLRRAYEGQASGRRCCRRRLAGVLIAVGRLSCRRRGASDQFRRLQDRRPTLTNARGSSSRCRLSARSGRGRFRISPARRAPAPVAGCGGAVGGVPRLRALRPGSPWPRPSPVQHPPQVIRPELRRLRAQQPRHATRQRQSGRSSFDGEKKRLRSGVTGETPLRSKRSILFGISEKSRRSLIPPCSTHASRWLELRVP